MTALMGTYGPPRRTLVRGDGCHVWDEAGARYLDLLAGIAVNALGHNHPAVVSAVTGQLSTLGHVSNFFTTPPQLALADRLAALIDPSARAFLCNSGTEAVEVAFKISRKTGRRKLVAADGSFHGRTMGALALTGQPSKRAPFEPLPGNVEFVPYGDAAALSDAVDDETAAVILEPIQGEGGVRPAPPGYLRAARSAADAHGALLVIDEVQTGIGRTGTWFAYQKDGITPDVITVAKGLGGGIPIGACIGIGRAASLLGRGEHGSTFGGNPIACAAGLAVLDTIERDGLLDHVVKVGEHLRDGIEATGHDLIIGVRGGGLLLAVALAEPVAARVADAALAVGFIVNDVAPDAIRIAPPLILTLAQADTFVAALPGILDRTRSGPTGDGSDTPQSTRNYQATAPLPDRGAVDEGIE